MGASSGAPYLFMKYFISSLNHCIEGFTNISIEESLKLLEPIKIMGLDSETKGFFPQIDQLCLLQLGDDRDQFVIDCLTIEVKRYKELIESRELIIIHNAKFDLRFLYHQGIYPAENVWDSFLAEKVINIGDITHRASLAHCVERYLGYKLKKENRGLLHRVGIYNKDVLEYAAEDVRPLIYVYERQLQQIIKKDLYNTISLENKFVAALSYIEYCGFGIDRDMWIEKINHDLEDANRKKALLDKYYLDNEDIGGARQMSLFDICSINWDSSQQVIPIMESLGIDVTVEDKKTGQKKKSIENKIIDPQRDKSPLVGYYLDYKAAQKLVSTYGNKFLTQLSKFEDYRLRTNFNQIMNSGRLSSGSDKEDVEESDIHNTNFQNIPRVPEEKHRTRKIYERECFTPTKGNVFVVCDYSQQEQVILANMSEDEGLLAFFRGEDSDMHAYVARKIWPTELGHLTSKEIKANFPDKRTIAKSAGFAINYGGSGFTISQNLGLSLGEGEEIYTSYMKAFPGLKNFFDQSENNLNRDNYILINNISGRKYFPYKYEELKQQYRSVDWNRYRSHQIYRDNFKPILKKISEARREAINYRVQGTGADMMKLAMYKTFRWIISKGYLNIVLMVNTIHDEIVLECPEALADECSKILSTNMEEASKLFCKHISVKAEPLITKKWTH